MKMMFAITFEDRNGNRSFTNLRKHVAPNKKALNEILKRFTDDGYKVVSNKRVPDIVNPTFRVRGKSAKKIS